MQTLPASPRRFQAALFDFDGTLADTLPLIALSWNHALGPIFGREFSLQEVVARFGPTDNAMIEREMRGHAPEAVERAIESYFARYESAHDAARAFDGVSEMLAQVRGAGFKVGLMTGKGRRAAEITLRLLGWQEAFDFVVTGDETSRPKPDPEGVLRVAHALGVEPERCIYVGDLPVDIRAGRAAGMGTVAAGWNAFDRDALRAEKPDFWAEAPADVCQVLAAEA